MCTGISQHVVSILETLLKTECAYYSSLLSPKDIRHSQIVASLIANHNTTTPEDTAQSLGLRNFSYQCMQS